MGLNLCIVLIIIVPIEAVNLIGEWLIIKLELGLNEIIIRELIKLHNQWVFRFAE